MYSNFYYSNELDGLSSAVIVGILIASVIIGIISYFIYSYIFWATAKTNGFQDAAYISWIPIFQFYMLFLLSAKGNDLAERRKNAKLLFWIYLGTILLAWIPILGILLSLVSTVVVIYGYYLLYLRWTAEKNKSILYTVATFITGGLFYVIYGLMHMKRPFKA